jgi:hypothetical protein
MPFPATTTMPDPSEDLSAGQLQTIEQLSVGIYAISFCGSLFVIISWVKFVKLRIFAFRLVLMMSIMDIGTCIAGFIGNPRTGSTACTVQGVMMQYFETSGFLWTTVIAFVLDRIVRRELFWLEMKGQLVLFGYALGVPLLFALLPFTATVDGSEAYANAGAWCFISTNNVRTPKLEGSFNVGTLWRFLCFYCPLWFCMVYNLVAYGRIIRILRSTLGGGSKPPRDNASQQVK